MKWPARILDFYLDASIHVALAVFSLLHITAYYIKLPEFDHLSYFVFFSTIGSYNFIKYGVEAEKYLLVTNTYHREIQFFSFAAWAIALYHGYFLSLETWFATGVLMLLTLGYALPVFPHVRQLRSLGLVKITLVSLIWAGTTVILPVISVSVSFTWNIGIEALQRFILVIVLLIPFEIRDLRLDNALLRTLPQRFGISKTIKIGYIAALVFFALTFIKRDVAGLEMVSKGFVLLILFIVLYFTKRADTKYFAAFWVEAVPIFWWLVIGVLSWVFA